MKHVQKLIKFSAPIPSSDLYRLMEDIAHSTGSDWQLTYERTVNHSLHFGESPRAYAKDARGELRRGYVGLELEVHAKGVYLEDDNAEPFENYFSDIKLIQPFGWRGGNPSLEEKERLEDYANEVVDSVLDSKSVSAKIMSPVEFAISDFD